MEVTLERDDVYMSHEKAFRERAVTFTSHGSYYGKRLRSHYLMEVPVERDDVYIINMPHEKAFREG